MKNHVANGIISEEENAISSLSQHQWQTLFCITPQVLLQLQRIVKIQTVKSLPYPVLQEPKCRFVIWTLKYQVATRRLCLSNVRQESDGVYHVFQNVGGFDNIKFDVTSTEQSHIATYTRHGISMLFGKSFRARYARRVQVDTIRLETQFVSCKQARPITKSDFKESKATRRVIS